MYNTWFSFSYAFSLLIIYLQLAWLKIPIGLLPGRVLFAPPPLARTSKIAREHGGRLPIDGAAPGTHAHIVSARTHGPPPPHVPRRLLNVSSQVRGRNVHAAPPPFPVVAHLHAAVRLLIDRHPSSRANANASGPQAARPSFTPFAQTVMAAPRSNPFSECGFVAFAQVPSTNPIPDPGNGDDTAPQPTPPSFMNWDGKQRPLGAGRSPAPAPLPAPVSVHDLQPESRS